MGKRCRPYRCIALPRMRVIQRYREPTLLLLSTNTILFSKTHFRLNNFFEKVYDSFGGR
jgi:hypothetical protein